MSRRSGLVFEGLAKMYILLRRVESWEGERERPVQALR